MQLTNTAPTNMLISTDTVVWSNGTTSDVDVTGGFSPTSSNDGVTFYAISSSDGIDVEGGIVNAGNIATVQFSTVDRVENSQTTYYAEVALYIKAGEQTSLVSDLDMTLAEFTVSSTTNHLEECVRVSVTEVGKNVKIAFNDDGSAYEVGDDPANTIDLSSATTTVYKYDDEAVKPIKTLSNTTYGTATLATEDPAQMAGSDDVCFSVDYTGMQYTTIIVRIWLEGQHPSCLNAVTGETVSVGLQWDVMDE